LHQGTVVAVNETFVSGWKEVVNLNTDVSLSVAMWNNVNVVYSNKSHCGSIQGSFAKNTQALIPFPKLLFYWKLYIKGDTVGLK
jgi:hypothetical protein